MKVYGALLAGGAASRLGGVVKPLLDLAGRTMAERALMPLRGHVERILVSTDRHELFAPFGFETVEDGRPERLGPLAGLAALYRAIRREDDAPFALLTVPGDTPFLPRDLAPRLLNHARPGTVRVAAFGPHWQPTVALWPDTALEDLPAWLDSDTSNVSIRHWIARHPHEVIEFAPTLSAPDGDPFFNVNTSEDLETARRHLSAIER
ncbi:molybdenum cofactor guanylyltransferase [Aureimonas sp. N4]|uniref:molybdenum cofactor guanylyltransferase n=1 Tax=Aureimonas sp. N4 TaxID=1638165 RepID=UPI0007861D59|nr:molybdenum cofactor guanylyltransferase [Aureimonas sp. N4]